MCELVCAGLLFCEVAHLILWLLFNNCCWKTDECYTMYKHNILYDKKHRTTIIFLILAVVCRESMCRRVFSGIFFVWCLPISCIHTHHTHSYINTVQFVQNAWLMSIMLQVTCDKSIMAISLRLKSSFFCSFFFIFFNPLHCPPKNTASIYTCNSVTTDSNQNHKF